MADDKKTNQATKPDDNTHKVDELPPKQVTDNDAQSVKGGMASSKWDKK